MAYTIIATIVSVFYMLMTWISVGVNRGYEYTGEAAKAEGKKEMNVISLPDLVKSVIQNPPLLTILIGAIISSSFNSAAMTGQTYNFRYIFDYRWFPIQMLLTSIVGTFGSYFAGWAGKTFGPRNAVLIGQAGNIISNVVIALFFAYTSPVACIVVMCIGRVFMSFSGANMQALYGDCVTYARWKFGKDTSAMVIGSQTIPIKIGLTLRGITVPLILSLTNFNPDPSIDQTNAPMELKRGIVIMQRWLPACGGLIYMLILFFGFRMLSKERMEQMQKDIDEREAAAREAEAAAAPASP
jgi:GPH family glycoside/pentoside/hexuronide:cation symporter